MVTVVDDSSIPVNATIQLVVVQANFYFTTTIGNNNPAADIFPGISGVPYSQGFPLGQSFIIPPDPTDAIGNHTLTGVGAWMAKNPQGGDPAAAIAWTRSALFSNNWTAVSFFKICRSPTIGASGWSCNPSRSKSSSTRVRSQSRRCRALLRHGPKRVNVWASDPHGFGLRVSAREESEDHDVGYF
jgi:hypothetical protein